jgi:hypothetical protein
VKRRTASAGEAALRARICCRFPVLLMIRIPARVNVSSVNTCDPSSGLVSAWVKVVADHRGEQVPHHLALGVVLGPAADVPLEIVDVVVERGQSLRPGWR